MTSKMTPEQWERKRAKQRAYRKNMTPEQKAADKAYKKKWYEAHAEEQRAKARERFHNDPKLQEKRRELKRLWAEKNRERVSNYRKQYKDKVMNESTETELKRLHKMKLKHQKTYRDKKRMEKILNSPEGAILPSEYRNLTPSVFLQKWEALKATFPKKERKPYTKPAYYPPELILAESRAKRQSPAEVMKRWAKIRNAAVIMVTAPQSEEETRQPRETGYTDMAGQMILEGDLIGSWELCDGKMILSAIPVLWWEEKRSWAVDMSFKKDGSYLEYLSDNLLGMTRLGTRGKNPEMLYPYPPIERD